MPDAAAVSRHVSVVVAATADAVYALAADPSRLPRWAAGLASTPLVQEGGSWFAEAPFGRVGVRFAPRNEFGVLDHVVTMPDGTEVLNPMRVIPLDGNSSEVVFTVRHRADQTDEQFAADVAAVGTDLATLRDLVERGRTLRGVTTPPDDTPGDRAESRAELLPEEREFPVQDADALAAQVLAESDARTDDPDAGRSGTATTGVTGDDPFVSDTD